MWRVSLIIFALSVPIALCQPPALLQNGVFNSASRVPAPLPGGFLAPGARFTITGVRLGGDTTATRVEIRSGERTYNARLVSVTPGSIEAILPAEVQPGTAELRVIRDGQASRPETVKVAASAPGLYSRNGLGWGPGQFDGVSPSSPATPGARVSLSVTGWNPGTQLFAGGRKVGRITASGGGKIVFQTPESVPEGCSVPVYAVTPAGVVSNVVTLAVRRSRGPCEEPADWPKPALRSGIVLLTHWSMLLEVQPGDPEPGEEETADAIFFAGKGQPAVLPIHVLPPAGTCSGIAGAYQQGDGILGLLGFALQAVDARGLDAGARIGISGPRGDRSMTGWGNGAYSGRLPRRIESYLIPGKYVLTSSGGPGAGAFAATLTAGEPLAWTNRDETSIVDRTKGVTLEWTGADPERQVFIAAVSVDRLSTASYAAFCAVPAGQSRFPIPPDALANLPATRIEAGPPMSLLLVMQSPRGAQAPIRAEGIDEGMALYIAGSGRSVVYR